MLTAHKIQCHSQSALTSVSCKLQEEAVADRWQLALQLAQITADRYSLTLQLAFTLQAAQSAQPQTACCSSAVTDACQEQQAACSTAVCAG